MGGNVIKRALEKEIKNSGEDKKGKEVRERKSDGDKSREEGLEGKEHKEAEPEHDQKFKKKSRRDGDGTVCFPNIHLFMEPGRHNVLWLGQAETDEDAVFYFGGKGTGIFERDMSMERSGQSFHFEILGIGLEQEFIIRTEIVAE